MDKTPYLKGYSKMFKKSVDLTYKYDEFEKSFAEFMVGFIQCYPHLIEKEDMPHMPGHELWIFKFWVEGDPVKEKLRLQEFKIEMIKK
jgi:hypothetical protein